MNKAGPQAFTPIVELDQRLLVQAENVASDGWESAARLMREAAAEIAFWRARAAATPETSEPRAASQDEPSSSKGCTSRKDDPGRLFLLCEDWEYEGPRFVGIFDSRERAMEAWVSEFRLPTWIIYEARLNEVIPPNATHESSPTDAAHEVRRQHSKHRTRGRRRS